MIAITPNEATITGAVLGGVLGAVGGGVVSFLTTRYALKHTPNYGEQISNIQREFGCLARTQEEMRLQMAEDSKAEAERHKEKERRAEAAQWKPTAQIISGVQGGAQVNTLSLKSPLEFALIEASLMSPSGAKLFDYPVLGAKTFSSGFGVPITHESLLLIANTSASYAQTSTFQGSLKYTVLRKNDGTQFGGEIRFQAQMAIVNSTAYFKLQG